MAAITHDDGGIPAVTADAHRAAMLWLVLVAWTMIGLVIGMVYGYFTDTRDWFDIASLPQAQQDDIQVMFFVHVAINYIVGAFLWAVGIVVLGLMALNAAARAEDSAAS